MIGGLLKSASRLALVAAAGVIAGGVGAQAADLGGNCCADLEERVAELEATTARKGTRRMGLQLYGQVSETMLYWDDGGEKNFYVDENQASKNRFGAQGTAKINSDWSAGFKLEWQVRAFRSSANNQLARGDNNGVTSTVYNTQSLSLRHAYWQLGSNTWGTIYVGQNADAVSGILAINLADPDGFQGSQGGEAMRGFRLRVKAGGPGNAGLSGQTWLTGAFESYGDGAAAFDYARATSIRYSTPTIAGFNLQASLGEDDFWSVGLRYAGDLGPFRLAAGVGYEKVNDDDRTSCANLDPAVAGGGGGAAVTPTVTAVDCNTIQAGASIMHTPTGLYVSGGWARTKDDNRVLAAKEAGLTSAAFTANDEDKYWWIQAGWEAKLWSLGKTTFWGEYEKWDTGLQIANNSSTQITSNTDVLVAGLGLGCGALPTGGCKMSGADSSSWGIGVTQDIDAAAMKIYLGYRIFSTDITVTNPTGSVQKKTNPVEDFQIFYTGATVKF